MIFNLDGQHAFIIADTEEGSFIYGPAGHLMDAHQMYDLGKRLTRTAALHKDLIDEHNLRVEKELHEWWNAPRTNTPKLEKTKASIYLLECGGRYKVGCSKNVERRIKELDNRPFPLNIVCKSPLLEDAFGKEQKLHEILNDYRIKGEWYDFPKEIVEKLTEKISTGQLEE